MVESRQKTHFGNESRECKKKQAGQPDKLICGLKYPDIRINIQKNFNLLSALAKRYPNAGKT